MGFETTTQHYDNLFAGYAIEPIAKKVTINSGNLVRGSVLGKLQKQKGTVGADGGNAGDATIGTDTISSGAMIGTYEIIAKEAAGASWEVINPKGDRLKDAASGAAYASDEINFTITEGGTPIEVGDKFTFEVAEHDDAGEYVLSAADAVDGSEEPDLILDKDVDASAEKKSGILAWSTGEFNKNALTLGAGHTFAAIEEGLRKKSIFLRSSLKTDGSFA